MPHLSTQRGWPTTPGRTKWTGTSFSIGYQKQWKIWGSTPRISIGNFVTTKKTSENHTDAVKGWVEAWQEGVDSMYSGDPRKVAVDYVDMMSANSEKEARMMVDWTIDIDPKVIPEDATIDNEYIKNDKAALNRLAELGIIEENWTEYVSYNPISL